MLWSDLISLLKFLKPAESKLLIFKLGKILKEFNFSNLLIFYPSMRVFLAAKIAGIKNIYAYKFFNKKRFPSLWNFA